MNDCQELLGQYLGRWASDTDAGRRAANYVLYGEDEGALAAVRQVAGAARWSVARPGPPNLDYRDTHNLLMHLVRLDDPRLLVRLAHVAYATYQAMGSMRLANPVWDEAPWLENWVLHLSNHLKYPPGEKLAITVSMLAAMLESEGQSPDLLVRPVLRLKKAAYTMESLAPRSLLEMLVQMPDYGDFLSHRADIIREHLASAANVDRVPVLEFLRRAKCDPAPFQAHLVEYATSDAKTLRESAQFLLAQIKDAARAGLERIAQQGSGASRGFAFELLASYYGADALPFLRKFQADELPKAARQGLETALDRATPPAEPQVPKPQPKAPAIPAVARLSDAGREAVRQLVNEYNQGTLNRGTGVPGWQNVRALSDAETQAVIDKVETLVLGTGAGFPVVLPLLFHLPSTLPAARRFVETADIELVHLLRVLLLANLLHKSFGRVDLMPAAHDLLDRFRRRKPFDLLDLAAVLTAIGIDERCIIQWIAGPLNQSFLRWPSESVTPFLTSHVEAIDELFHDRPEELRFLKPTHSIEILEHFSELPPILFSRMWNRAIGPAAAERIEAQRLLNKTPDLDRRLIACLADGSSDVRANAAHWLADRKCVEAIPKIAAAFQKEKSEVNRDVLLVALERLGARVEQYLDRDGLMAESRKVLAKGAPKLLDWFPFEQLPEAHWEDTGTKVEPEILQAFLVRSCKLATPAPGPLLRGYCRLFRQAERERLGQFILDAWIARDLGEQMPKGPAPVVVMPTPKAAPPAAATPPVVPQAMQTAMAQLAAIQQVVQSNQAARWAQFKQGTPPASGSIPPALQQLQATMSQLVGQLTGVTQMGSVRQSALPAQVPSTSAIKQKGILAVAAACCGDSAVAAVDAYLKRWYGYRAAQCRALVSILPWMDSRPATQLLLATGRRFRTAGIQEEAEIQCSALAARKGWSTDQLGDRTIPAAGFEDGPAQELDLGGRRLTLALTPRLTVELRNAEGKTLKDFPAALKGDTPGLYDEAKQTYAQAKKSAKTIVTQQTQRLYESMCSERKWRFGELREFLFDHPIVGRLCERLVWQAIEPATTFRLLDDGTLSDAHDGEVTMPEDAEVRIAYGPANAGEWLRHLADYKVEPLFPQLDRPLPAPPDPASHALRDFQGHSVGFFHLRGMAAKFGYQHGPIVDGPHFSTYVKRYSNVDINVELEFSGMEMPGENKPVILVELRFLRGQALPLGQVPRVLLSECWHDLRAIAAGGTGFDPDWEKKLP